MNAEAIRIETDDRGFELIIDLDEDICTHGQKYARVHVNIHGCAEELWNECVKHIGPWLLEAQDARREFESGIADDPTQQAVLDRIKGDPYAEDDGPWPNESVMEYYRRTGRDGPLREVADAMNKARREGN